jgi:hypothetical protein
MNSKPGPSKPPKSEKEDTKPKKPAAQLTKEVKVKTKPTSAPEQHIKSLFPDETPLQSVTLNPVSSPQTPERSPSKSPGRGNPIKDLLSRFSTPSSSGTDSSHDTVIEDKLLDISSDSSLKMTEQERKITALQQELADVKAALKEAEETRKEEEQANIQRLSRVLTEMAGADAAVGSNLLLNAALGDVLKSMGVKMENPTRDELLTATGVAAADRKTSVKLARSIQTFNGEKGKAFEEFMTSFYTAVMCYDYTDAELKVIFFQNLRDKAAQHYQANLVKYKNMEFQQILETFRKRFGLDPREVIRDLRTATQKGDEDALSFMDRIQAMSVSLDPPEPMKHRVITDPVTNERKIIPNPTLATEQYTRDVKIKDNDRLRIDSFLTGLRPEIKAQLKQIEFETLHDAGLAAEQAEKHLKLTGLSSTLAHLTLEGKAEKTEEINYNTGREVLKDMDERGRERRWGKRSQGGSRGAAGAGNCFECGQRGHWRRECPNRRSGNGRRSRYRFSRSGSRDRSFNRSRSRSRLREDDITEVAHMLRNVRFRSGRSRSRSPFRRNSTPHPRNRSWSRGSSRFRSRSNSRSRSSSRNRYPKND